MRQRRHAEDEAEELDPELEEEFDEAFEDDVEDLVDDEDFVEEEVDDEEELPTEEDYSDVPSVFLGGTTAESTWRADLIGMLEVGYFDPVVEEWDEDAQENERYWREHCDYVLYCITEEMSGVYSIAEVVDDSNKRPGKALFCYIGKFDEQMTNSLEAVAELVNMNGGQSFTSLKDVAEFLNGTGADE